MPTWLAAAAAVASLTAHVQVDESVANPPSASDFTLPTIPQFKSRSLVQDGMIAQQELAPNAHIGVGLAPMQGRNVHSVRIEMDPVPTNNPGVTFVIRFPG